MTILLECYTIPERGLFEIDLKQSIEICVTAEEARRKVNRWLLDYVSYMMHAEAPTLVIGEQVIWRVPAVLTASQIGNVGIGGYVEVDVKNGQMNNSVELKEQITQRALALAAKLPPYRPLQTVSEEFIPKNIPRARMIELPTDDEA